MKVIQLRYLCSKRVFPTSPNDLVIRQLRLPDDELVIRMVTESVLPDDRFRPAVPAVLREMAGDPGRAVGSWLALIDERPVGLATLVASRAGDAVRHSVAWLLVSGQARRRGVGRGLAAAALRAARDRGAREVWVETHSDWLAAVAFWQAVGFRPVSHR